MMHTVVAAPGRLGDARRVTVAGYFFATAMRSARAALGHQPATPQWMGGGAGLAPR